MKVEDNLNKSINFNLIRLRDYTNLYISFPAATANTTRPNDSSNCCLETQEQETHCETVWHLQIPSGDDENESNQDNSNDRENADIVLEVHQVHQIVIPVHIKNGKNVCCNIHKGSREDSADDNGC